MTGLFLMKNISKISTLMFLSFVMSGCSNLEQFNVNNPEGSSKNPLKTAKDLKIE